MAKDINSKRFSEETRLKLDIFQDCFKEWLPVFIQQPYWRKLYIYDFFAGSGYDTEGNPGSPMILLEETVSLQKSIVEKQKNVILNFNEYKKRKQQQLQTNIEEYLLEYRNDHDCKDYPFEVNITNYNFSEDFKNNNQTQFILNNKQCAKFVILDQYGFTQVDAEIFLKLVNAPHTDFIFFISSSYLKRFKEHPVTKKFLGERNLTFEETAPKLCHQIIVEYFESLIPHNKDYYLNHFTIKKGTNYYGLIFGTSHTLGMEKFQKVCWSVDQSAGESNCNTQEDFEKGTLFYEITEPNKIHKVKECLKKEIVNDQIMDNIQGLKRALKLRCEPKVFTEVIKELEKENKIERIGSKSYTSVNIHRIKANGKDYYSIKKRI